MIKKGLTYYLYCFTALALLPGFRNAIHAQDVLLRGDYCEKAAQLNLESEYARTSDRRLALSKAEQALAIAEQHACSEMEALAHRNIGIIYYFTGSYDEAGESFTKSMQIYNSIADTVGISSVYNNMGLLLIRKSDFNDAYNYLMKSHDLSEAAGDRAGVAKALLNISHVHFYQGRFSDALSTIRKAILIHGEIDDVRNKLLCQNTLAAIYETQGLYYEALEIFDQALQSAIELNDEASRSTILHNIGMIYYELEEYHKALDVYTQSLLIKIDLDDKAGISLCLSNMGSVFRALGRMDESNAHFAQALKIDQELGNQMGIAIQLAQIAGNLLDKKEPLSAIDYYQQSNEIASGINARHLLKENFMYLVQAYLAVNNYDLAYDYMVKYITFRDDMIISPEELEGYGQTRLTSGRLTVFSRKTIGRVIFDVALVLSIALNLVLLFLVFRKYRR